MYKIVVCGASSIKNIQNFGDELLRDLYIHWSKDAIPQAEIEFLRYDGLWSRKKEWRNKIPEADLLIFNGGGYFGEKPFLKDSKIKQYLKKIAWGFRNNDLYGSVFDIAKENTVPVIISGVEIGPVTNPIFSKKIVNAINYSSYCCVRNRESFENAVEMGARANKINQAIDSAMNINMEVCDALYPDKAPSDVQNGQGSFNLGLHIHEIKTEEELEGYIALIAMIKEAIPPELDFNLFYIHDQRKNGTHPERSKITEEKISGAFPSIKIVDYFSPGKLLRNIANLHLVVTTKLHLGIVSRALSIPVISCPSHTTKTKRFYKYLKEEDFCKTIWEHTQQPLPKDLHRHLSECPHPPFPVINEVRTSALEARTKFQAALIEVFDSYPTR